MTLNLAVILEESAKRRPEKPALVFGEKEMSYGELRDAAGKFANALASVGVEPGDKAAIMIPNVASSPSPTTASCLWATPSCPSTPASPRSP